MEVTAKKEAPKGVKPEYRNAVREALKLLDGKLSAQNIECVVIYNEPNRRFSLFMVGEMNGQDVMSKPILVNLLDDDKIEIVKNNTDLDLRKELVNRGVLDEDII